MARTALLRMVRASGSALPVADHKVQLCMNSSRRVRRIITCAGAVFVVALLPRCGQSIYCAASTFACHCENAPFTLKAGYHSVSDCDGPPNVPSGAGCLHNFDDKGQSTVCACSTYGCAGTSPTECTCGFLDWFEPSFAGPPVDSCSSPFGCCDYQTSCSCTSDVSSVVCSSPGGYSYSGGWLNDLPKSCANVHWAPSN